MTTPAVVYCGTYGCNKPVELPRRYCTPLHRKWDELRLADLHNDVRRFDAQAVRARTERDAIDERLHADPVEQVTRAGHVGVGGKR